MWPIMRSSFLAECLETSLSGNLATLNAIAQPYFVPSELAINEANCSNKPNLATFSTYDLCAPNIAMIDVRAVNWKKNWCQPAAQTSLHRDNISKFNYLPPNTFFRFSQCLSTQLVSFLHPFFTDHLIRMLMHFLSCTFCNLCRNKCSSLVSSLVPLWQFCFYHTEEDPRWPVVLEICTRENLRMHLNRSLAEEEQFEYKYFASYIYGRCVCCSKLNGSFIHLLSIIYHLHGKKRRCTLKTDCPARHFPWCYLFAW